jgi:hypothetical protein
MLWTVSCVPLFARPLAPAASGITVKPHQKTTTSTHRKTIGKMHRETDGRRTGKRTADGRQIFWQSFVSHRIGTLLGGNQETNRNNAPAGGRFSSRETLSAILRTR